MVKKLRRQNEGVCKCLRMSTGGREGRKKSEIPSTQNVNAPLPYKSMMENVAIQIEKQQQPIQIIFALAGKLTSVKLEMLFGACEENMYLNMTICCR